ncbi:ABC-type transport system permease protein (probable substrate sugar) [Haladaptatus paucihalophilus DX253]|uniref:ABC-type transport system permease protein (Probable substrate sugar) n=1 Tax=Haladaptatus paucihalophilus DX253 TaxID=797209 RepID=E7QS45_HALPU|nr:MULTISPECIES: ABC transporter permease [Haladaptatus]EFW92814.1 ABC-type transport system permease protein (probable substrate sugar) [Haladaptatus paucihalophilus DX253]GKZ13590.1 ABC transporter permease [Haladaptatus sp. T7]SHK11873.1 nucleoside ABC transporter membrane protein [Haladaptatus paucihalophilus DX253]
MSSWQDRAEQGLSRLVEASAVERVLISLAALVMSIIVGGFVILISGWVATCSDPFLAQQVLISIPGTGGWGVQFPIPGSFCYNPIQVYKYLFVGSFANPQTSTLFPPDFILDKFSLAVTLRQTSMLLFAGLAAAVAFRAGMFNIGTQGQLVLGALGSALSVLWVAPYVPGGLVGSLILIPLGLVVGALVGGAYGAIPGAMKAYADANEVITTIMLNFVATGIAFVLVSEYFKNPASQTVETRPVPGAAVLSPIVFPSQASFSILVLVGALALAVGIYLLLHRTAFGYDLRTSGIQPEAAEYGGVDAKRTMVSSMALSGAIAGIGGTVYVLMILGRWQQGVPSYGFDGITVTILAGNNPLGVPLAALLFGMLKSGSLAIDFALGVPKQLVGVLRGLIILFVAMPEFFRMIGKRVTTPEPSGAVAADGGSRIEGGEDDE